MHTDSIEPFMAVTKEIEFRFSFGYTPAEFAATLDRLADRGARAPSCWSPSSVDLAGAPGAFETLRTPGEHGKILVNRRHRRDPTPTTTDDMETMTTIDADDHLKFGIFLAPFHPVGQNPTLALERDLQLIEHLDELGFDEAWFGEHHSAGYEIIASPEVFIAAAAQRTRHIRLGTGVSSLPYHHPFMLADRMVLLDHLTRGRRHDRRRTRAPCPPTPS